MASYKASGCQSSVKLFDRAMQKEIDIATLLCYVLRDASELRRHAATASRAYHLALGHIDAQKGSHNVQT